MNVKPKAVLFDIEGTLYTNHEWIKNADETIEWLIENGIKVRFVTNKTTANQAAITKLFSETKLNIPQNWIYTPASTARKWFGNQHIELGILPLVHSSVLGDLEGLLLTQNDSADYVLVGNMDKEWDIEILNTAVRALLKGAKLTTLELNRTWVAGEGHRLLAGPFVKALEYAANTSCEIVFGKPSQLLFHTILSDVCAKPTETIMVGDDLQADILGAVNMGMRGFLVKTGNFSGDKTDIQNKSITVANSVSDIIKFISNKI